MLECIEKNNLESLLKKIETLSIENKMLKEKIEKDKKPYLRPKEAAKYLGIGVSTVWLYAQRGELNPIVLSEKVILYDIDELDAFVQSKRINQV